MPQAIKIEECGFTNYEIPQVQKVDVLREVDFH